MDNGESRYKMLALFMATLFITASILLALERDKRITFEEKYTELVNTLDGIVRLRPAGDPGCGPHEDVQLTDMTFYFMGSLMKTEEVEKYVRYDVGKLRNMPIEQMVTRYEKKLPSGERVRHYDRPVVCPPPAKE